MASENNSVICDEVFEEGYQPSNEGNNTTTTTTTPYCRYDFVCVLCCRSHMLLVRAYNAHIYNTTFSVIDFFIQKSIGGAHVSAYLPGA